MIYLSEIRELASKNGISEEAIEKDYCLNWFLLGLSSVKYAKHFVFFGGTALRKVYFKDYRLSEDLDFMYKKPAVKNGILSFMDSVYSILRRKANINYSTDTATIFEENARLQFFVKYDGFADITAGGKSFKLDFSLELDFIEKPCQKGIIGLYSDMKAEKRKLFCYSLEAIAAEKLGAILGRKRHEPRDVYDLWRLMNSKKMDKHTAFRCFRRKYGFLPTLAEIERALANEIYNTMWQMRLAHQISDLIVYDRVKSELLAQFRYRLNASRR